MHPANNDPLPTSPGQRVRFFAGFAGWAPGQLQRELQLDGWFVLPVTDDLLFRTDTRGLWKELLEKARGSRASAAFLDMLRS
jgi:putative transcriptional regulator